MIFRTASIAIFMTASTTFVTANPDEARSLCYDNYHENFSLELGPDACTSRNIFKSIKDLFVANRQANKKRCINGANNEFMALTGTTKKEDAEQVIRDLCKDALELASEELRSISWDDLGVDLGVFFQGSGILNEETGNFQQEKASFEGKNGGSEKFVYIGTDPRKNDHYPTTDESYTAGQAIKAFYDNKSKSNFFDPPTSNFGAGCSSNTAMCCWHRDRQYNDKNGDCRASDCANQNPGDNTDLCWTEGSDGTLFPYPGSSTENDLHCHGISWGDEDLFGDDINTRARWNSLFYVSMYDHLYQRGYAESITNDGKIGGKQDMCGCVEDMAPVARADCSQVVGKASYTATIDPTTQRIEIATVENTFELEFQSCQGVEFVEGLTSEDLAQDPGIRNDLKSSNNDLSAFVFRQYLDGKLDEAHVEAYEETVIGYRHPEVNDSDKKREAVCKNAFEDRFPNAVYEEVLVEQE